MSMISGVECSLDLIGVIYDACGMVGSYAGVSNDGVGEWILRRYNLRIFQRGHYQVWECLLAQKTPCTKGLTLSNHLTHP